MTGLALYRAWPWRIALCAALSSSCHAAEPQVPRAPTSAAAPELPLPNGLDVAVRVDIAALSGELGQEPARQFLLDAISLGGADRRGTLLGRTLDRASLLWFGLASSPSLAARSGVLLLRGHFADVSGDGASWSRRDSGIDLLELGPDGGDGYSRVYRLPGAELMVWAPAGELPRVERALAGEGAESALRPPERGAVSVAARPAGVLERTRIHYPELSARFHGVQRIEAFAEPTAGMWRADLTLDFASAAQASDASQLLERLRQALTRRRCAVGVVARAVAVTAFEHDVRVQTVLMGSELDAVKACVLGDGCCA